MALKHAPRIVTDGLVLALDAANPKSYPGSGTTWKDLSGNGNDGTLTNGPTFSGDNVGNVVFDGSNDYVSFNNTSTFNFGTSDITFSFFIKINDNSFNRWNSLYIKRIPSTVDDIRTYVRPESSQDGYLRLYFASNTSMDVRTNIINNVGYYLVDFILDRDSNWSIYINGQYVGQYSQAAFTTSSNTNISGSGTPEFGRQLTSEYTRLNLSTFKVYNRALSAEEVLQNYNATKSRFYDI